MPTLSFWRTHIAFVAIAVVVAVLSLKNGGVAPVISSGNFAPTTTLTLSDHAPGANPDSTLTFNIAAGQMLGESVALTPQAATLSASPTTIPSGLGDVVGTLTTNSTVGLNNGPCNVPVAATATLLSASVDNSAGNLIYPSLPAEADSQGQLSPLRHDVYTVSPGIGSAGPGSAAPGPANGLPSHADRYPAFLNTVFDPDGAGPNPALAPLARYSGSTVALASQIVLFQAVVFAPGALAAYAPPATFSDLGSPTLGYATIVVMNDPTAVPLPGGAITDLCSPLGTTSTLYGITKTNPCAGNTLAPCNTDDGINSPVAGLATGRVRYANPATAGTYSWYGFHTSARNSDGDGIENSLDTCPYAVNMDGDPRTTSGADSDMIDSICDPTPAVDTGAGDHDGDGYKNAADNCPLIANPTQAQAEENEPTNIASPRGGSTTDALGDACDGAETTCGANVDNDMDGLVNDGCPTVGAATAETTCTFSTSSEVDNDRDGFPNDGCPPSGTPETGSQCDDALDDDSDGSVNDGCPSVGGSESGALCANGTDDDFDGENNDGCPAVGAPETGAQCGNNAADEDSDGAVNDGCPANLTPTREFACGNVADDDTDGAVNDGCQSAGPGGAESGADCEDFANDDPVEDTLVNDGCPAQGGAELGCLNSTDDDVDGSFNDGCQSSANVANGHYHTVLTVMPRCIGGTDADGDGWCATGQSGVASDPADGDAGRTPETYSQFRPFMVAHAGSGNNPPSSREPLQACNDGIDNDGDALVDLLDGTSAAAVATDDCRPPDAIFTSGPDTDGDSSRDEVEIHVGTDPLSRCHRGNDPNSTTPSRGWSRDVRGESSFSNDRVNVSDLQAVFARFGSPGSANFDRRADLRPGSALPSWINVSDLAALANTAPVPSHGISVWLFGSVCSAHKVYND
jgi:hypothetical protein